MRKVTDGEMTILATPIQAAFDAFDGDPKLVTLAVFGLGLDIGRKDPAIASRMSEVAAAILTGGEALNEDTLDATIALINILFIVEDAKNDMEAKS